MYDDVESDFWKELFVNVQHKNMVRAGAEKLEFSNCKNAFDDFKNRNPDLKISTDFSSSYCIFEVEITPTVKLRLFIQSSIKATLLQFDGGDYVKIADAKFPYNPFPEIQEFLSKKDEYIAALNQKKEQTLHNKKQMKVALEFINAAVSKKFAFDKNIVWSIEPKADAFLLKIQAKDKKTECTLSIDSFYKELENLKI